ncbi:hypothetical protein NDN13_11160 [Acinetobacter sp. C32I]|uniref:hypothetical protein n=1 Tax=Acinetobacter sp. C32I TaxID=2950074 RepID=UPI0020369EFE|nr:hypothetical protein [Acinetobacter sp. C32I]USA52053.1 hypothetical protein NDN13_11160 [Acinetobacter sp. C32I]
MPRAKLISTRGRYLDAVIEVDQQIYHVFDEFSLDEIDNKEQHCFDFDWSIECADDESWDEIFINNVEQKYGLVHLSGWTYYAFGQIVNVNPVVVDCQVLQVEDVVISSDEQLVGEWVRFTICRLGCFSN